MRRYLYSFALAASLCLGAIPANAADIAELRHSQNISNHNDDRVAIVLGIFLIPGIIVSISSNQIYQQYNRWLMVRQIHQIIALERALQKASHNSY
jgi:O-antigen/teichoic acid export membrane protein